MPAMVTRNEAIDTLRGAAGAAVIHIHCLQPFYQTPTHPWHELLRVGLDFATPSFFFISGFVSPREPSHGFNRRLGRMLLPYVVATLLREVFEWLSQRIRHSLWRELLHQLALTNLQAHWREDCLLHERLAEYESMFDFSPPTPSARGFAQHVFLGTSFGFFYFVVVLTQLQIVAVGFARCANERTATSLVLAVVLLQLATRIAFFVVFVNDGSIAIAAVLRFPATWAGFFFVGYYLRHFVAVESQTRADLAKKARTAWRVTALALGGSVLSQALGAPNIIVLVLKEPYLYALPVATALTGASVEQPAEPVADLSPPTSDVTSPRKTHKKYYDIAVNAALQIRDAFSRYSYSLYLYHGFFNDDKHLGALFHEPFFPRALEVTCATFVFVRAIEVLCKPEIAFLYFGVAPNFTFAAKSDHDDKGREKAKSDHDSKGRDKGRRDRSPTSRRL